MKKLARVEIGIILAFILLTPYAVLAEQGKTPDHLMLLPQSTSTERKLSNELSTPRYVVSQKQKIAQEMAAITTMAIIDYNQSVAMFSGSDGYYELNPLLGKKPTKTGLMAFGVISLGLVYVLEKSLPESWRQIVIDSIVASERINIEDNRRIHNGWNTDGPPIRGRSFNGVPIVICFRF